MPSTAATSACSPITGPLPSCTEAEGAGEIWRLGFSFHDLPEFPKQVLTDHPELEFVKRQFKYPDNGDPKVASLACDQVCATRGKPVIVMEPIKGGSLAGLPAKDRTILDALEGAAMRAMRSASPHPSPPGNDGAQRHEQ